MEELQEKLKKLGWDQNMLLKHLDTLLNRKKKDKERFREYFLKNKEKLYEYHAEYRRNHPEYRRKKSKQSSGSRLVN